MRLQWLPQGNPGSSVAPVDITINARSGIASEDFVTNYLHVTGLGSILVTATTSTGETDTAGQLVATSRIWTLQPGSSGSVSQSLPSVAMIDINSTTVAIQGMRRDSRFRSNVGIVNVSSLAQHFQVIVAGSGGTESQQVDVPAQSMVLFQLTGADSSFPIQIQVSNSTSPAGSPLWIAFASSVDNVTGDAWTTLGSNLPQ